MVEYLSAIEKIASLNFKLAMQSPLYFIIDALDSLGIDWRREEFLTFLEKNKFTFLRKSLEPLCVPRTPRVIKKTL